MPQPTTMQYRSGELLRQAYTATVRAVQKTERVVDFILSTEARDRYNTEVAGWKLKNFRANPAITWAHTYTIPLIGNGLRVGVDPQKRLVVRAEFTPPEINPFGHEVYTSIKEGWMRTYSAGFVPEKVEFRAPTPEEETKGVKGYYRLLSNDLLEGAVAPVPANAECTTLAVRALGHGGAGFDGSALLSSDVTPEDYKRATDSFIEACKALKEWNGEEMKAAQKRVVDFFAKRKCETLTEVWDYGDNACRNCGAEDDSTHALDCEHSRTAPAIEREAAAQEREKLTVPSIARALNDEELSDDEREALDGFATRAANEKLESLRRYEAESKNTLERDVVDLTPQLSDEQLEVLLRQLGITKPAPGNLRGCIPFKKQKTADAGEAFNAGAEAAAASIDDLWEMSAWFADAGEKKSDYKLLHHKQAGYETVWAGVKNAMAQLNGGRGGVQVPTADKARCFRHLALHYAEFQQDVPELKTKSADGAWMDCTPEFFFERIAQHDAMSVGIGLGGASSLLFARSVEGASSHEELATIAFRAGELASEENVATEEDRFMLACRFVYGEMTEAQRGVLSALFSRTVTPREGFEQRLALTILDGFMRGFEDEEPKHEGPTVLECARLVSKARANVNMTTTQVAALVPLTQWQVEALEARTEVGEFSTLAAQLEAVAPAIGLTIEEVHLALDKDVKAHESTAEQKSAAMLRDVSALLTETLSRVQGIVGGDHLLRDAAQEATDDSESGNDEGDAVGLAASILEDYMRGGSVDAAQRVQQRRSAQGKKEGGGADKPANNADLIRLAEMLRIAAAAK